MVDDGNIHIIRGHLAGPLKAEELPIAGEVEAIIIDLRPAEMAARPKVEARTRLNVRDGPGTNYNIVGKFEQYDVTDALEEKQMGEDIWVRIGYHQWCAMLYRGVVYCAYVE